MRAELKPALCACGKIMLAVRGRKHDAVLQFTRNGYQTHERPGCEDVDTQANVHAALLAAPTGKEREDGE